jgi:hypothetical protein
MGMEKKTVKLALEKELDDVYLFGNYKFNGLRQFNVISKRSTTHMNSSLWYDKEKNQFLLLKDFKVGKCNQHIDYFKMRVTVDDFIFLMSCEKDVIHLGICDGIRDVVYLDYDAENDKYIVTGYSKSDLDKIIYCYRYENLKNEPYFEMWWK